MRHNFLKFICIGTYAYSQTERFNAKTDYFSKMLEDSSFQLHSMISYDVHAEALTVPCREGTGPGT